MTRDLIYGILMDITKNGEYSHLALRNVLNKHQYLSKTERAFITRVTEGTMERMLELDYIIDQFSSVKVRKMKPPIRTILRMGVYQLKYMENVPDSAACNEAVKLAEKYGFRNLKGFVNGVLRNIARNINTIELPDDLSIRYSMPQWILNQWLNVYDKKTVETMLEGFFAEQETTIRCNPMVMSKEELKKSLETEGVQVEEHPYLPYALRISNYDFLADLDAFQKGAFYVQDISSMMVTQIANPKEGDYVVDVCAAPGGKALHMAEALNGTGHVEARDLTDYKVSLIEENIARSQMQNVEAVKWDATVLDVEMMDQADIVVADLPCSGLGILGKKTDIKYKMTEETQKSLVQLQREILTQVKEYVKPGGTLVYSTCTIHHAENISNVEWFLKQNDEFELVPIQELLCDELKPYVEKNGCLQLLPGVHKSDGFFIAKMKRKKHG